jgi:hypothetical protein
MKAHLIPGLLFVVACGAAGGTMQYKLAPGPAIAAPIVAKPANCTFMIESSPPTGSYDTLGTLTPVDFAAGSQDELKGAIQAQVCQLGGEEVLSTQNTTGQYTSAIVLRKHVNPPADGGGSAAPAPAPAP